MKNVLNSKKVVRGFSKVFFSVLAVMLIATPDLLAQDIGAGTTALTAANTAVRGFFGPAVNLMYAVAAIVGLIGAVKVYQKFSSGDGDTGKVAAGWFGAAIFLVVAATAISAFFGVA
jgi:phosphoglycerol transferase MdoB-like AlkP superfamily enzyme